ncbi:MAG: sugar phosphate isomerase/epimerase [Bacteroidales bacterium]|nr:sugar phosphate isomerase/epimerase [Bacteroidales bacterium]MCM1415167.1 sugar phosphate isomerase/epimerase [bacterium]MCM1423373.1 sugar phosphate isomerase/epimerase [bacterium]
MYKSPESNSRKISIKNSPLILPAILYRSAPFISRPCYSPYHTALCANLQYIMLKLTITMQIPLQYTDCRNSLGGMSMKCKLAAFADEVDENLAVQISAMQENDIEYLEIRGVDGESVSDFSVKKAQEIRQRLDAAGLSVWSVGSPFGKIGITDDFAPHLEGFKRQIETAHILGAKRMRIFSFYVPGETAEHYSDEVMARLEKFLDAAKGSGILLCHENEKDIYGDIASRCAEIQKNFPAIKAVFDPANFIQCGQDTKAAWEMLTPYIEYMHIKDALADGSVVPAGKGIGNIPFLLENYTGEVLTVEPHLWLFPGYEKLEHNNENIPKEYPYTSSREAFDAAVSALKALL